MVIIAHLAYLCYPSILFVEYISFLELFVSSVEF